MYHTTCIEIIPFWGAAARSIVELHLLTVMAGAEVQLVTLQAPAKGNRWDYLRRGAPHEFVELLNITPKSKRTFIGFPCAASPWPA